MSEDKREGVTSRTEFALTIKPIDPTECDIEDLNNQIREKVVVEGLSFGSYRTEDFGFGIKFLILNCTTVDGVTDPGVASSKIVETFKDIIQSAEQEY